MKYVKRVLILIIIAGGSGLLIYKYGIGYFFTPGAVREVREKHIDKLKEEAEKSEKEYKDELETAERAGYANEKLGMAYLKRKNWTPAIEALKKSLEYGRSGARVHYSLGVAYANRAKNIQNKSDIENAERHYIRAIEINPKIYDAHYGRAILLFYMKNEQKEAVSLLRKIISDDREYYRAHFALGRIYYEMKMPSKSLAAYEELYSILESKRDSTRIKEYKKSCKENISRIMLELSGSK